MTDSVDSTRVLLVDDDPVFVRRARQALAPITELRTVSTGSAGLAAVPAWRPDVILFDLLMHDLDGFTFLEEVSRSSLESPPFILCTTDGRGADTRVWTLPSWRVGTLVRSSTVHELRIAVIQAARCQGPVVQRWVIA